MSYYPSRGIETATRPLIGRNNLGHNSLSLTRANHSIQVANFRGRHTMCIECASESGRDPVHQQPESPRWYRTFRAHKRDTYLNMHCQSRVLEKRMTLLIPSNYTSRNGRKTVIVIRYDDGFQRGHLPHSHDILESFSNRVSTSERRDRYPTYIDQLVWHCVERQLTPPRKGGEHSS